MGAMQDDESPAILVFDIRYLRDTLVRLCDHLLWLCTMRVLDNGTMLAVTIKVPSGAVYDLSVTSTDPETCTQVDIHMHDAHARCFTRRATALSIIDLVVSAETCAVLGDDE